MDKHIEKALKQIKDEKIAFVELLFGDLFGTTHHFTLTASQFTAEKFEDGVPFDGSSIRAWQSINKSDMLLMPDARSAFIDPFRAKPTLCFFSNVHSPYTGKSYEKDPRSVLKQAIEVLKATGLADTIYIGPEPEFFVFDSVRYLSDRNCSFYEIQSEEGPWTSQDEDSLAHKIAHKGGYFPVPPNDTLVDYRNEVVEKLENMNVVCELHHHEVATAGQCEINFRYAGALESADNVNKLKYVVKNTALEHGKTATFMPKPIFEDNGSGMHTHISFWKDGKNLFHGDQYGSLSKMALHAIAGLLHHGKSIQVFTNPTANSYRRIIPGYEAPVKLAYSNVNRSAAIRIPFVNSAEATRFEFRCPDASGSPYLAFAALIMACADGIKNQMDPGEPMDKNIYGLPPEELEKLPSTCASQEEAFAELEKDNEYLRSGDVFSEELLLSYAEYRKESEIEPLKLRPNPYEFALYYSV